MKNLIVFLFFGTIVNYSYSQENAKKALTDAEKIVGLSTCWSEAKYNFVYYDKLTFDWDSLYQATIPAVLETKDIFEYYRVLQRFIASLKDGHTSVSPPLEFWKNWSTIPVVVRLIEDKVIVTAVHNDELEKTGIKVGLEVTKINGMNINDYVSTYIKPYIPSSTSQWLDIEAYGRECTRGKKSEAIRLTFKDDKGTEFERSISNSMLDTDDKRGNLFDFKLLDNNIGLLKISSFMGEHFAQEFDSIYQLTSNASSLIIDIRGNGGGYSTNSVYVLSHLTNQKFKMSDWSSPIYIPAFASWKYPKEWNSSKSEDYSPVKGKPIFEKPVVLLIDARTFSSAEDFCVGFRTMKRGLIVGTPSGGSTGNAITFELPGGGLVDICTKKDIYSDGTEFVGIGIIPDIEVKETISSVLSTLNSETDYTLAKSKAIQILKTK